MAGNYWGENAGAPGGATKDRTEYSDRGTNKYKYIPGASGPGGSPSTLSRGGGFGSAAPTASINPTPGVGGYGQPPTDPANFNKPQYGPGSAPAGAPATAQPGPEHVQAVAPLSQANANVISGGQNWIAQNDNTPGAAGSQPVLATPSASVNPSGMTALAAPGEDPSSIMNQYGRRNMDPNSQLNAMGSVWGSNSQGAVAQAAGPASPATYGSPFANAGSQSNVSYGGLTGIKPENAQRDWLQANPLTGNRLDDTQTRNNYDARLQSGNWMGGGQRLAGR